MKPKSTNRCAVVVLLAILMMSAWACADDGVVQQVSPQEAARLTEENNASDAFVILDIRTPKEFNAGHIVGAVLLDYYSPEFITGLKRLDKQKTYLVYCRTGNRTGKAMALFEEAGLEKVYELAGGISAWMAKDYPVVR
jgi:rhodanese-related sulfurtransferase